MGCKSNMRASIVPVRHVEYCNTRRQDRASHLAKRDESRSTAITVISKRQSPRVLVPDLARAGCRSLCFCAPIALRAHELKRLTQAIQEVRKHEATRGELRPEGKGGVAIEVALRPMGKPAGGWHMLSVSMRTQRVPSRALAATDARMGNLLALLLAAFRAKKRLRIAVCGTVEYDGKRWRPVFELPFELPPGPKGSVLSRATVRGMEMTFQEAEAGVHAVRITVSPAAVKPPRVRVWCNATGEVEPGSEILKDAYLLLRKSADAFVDEVRRK